MLFNTSIRKELAQTFAAILAVLLTIVITVMLIRTLSMASKGAVSPQDVMLVLGYVMLGYIPMLLSLTMFLTIVFVLARMYRDSEMVIWQGAGAGTLRLLKPIFTFTWPIITGIIVLMLVIWPWANQQITSIGLQFQQRSEINRIQPGQFQVSSNLKRVVFIERQVENSQNSDYPEGKNVFLYTNDLVNNKLSIISAQTAHVEVHGDEKYLVLTDGQQIEFDRNTEMRTVLVFDSYKTLVSDTQEIINPAQKSKERDTLSLLEDPTAANLGELSWRLGFIIASLNLIIIAIPLGYANPRSGRNTSLLYALLTFVIYFNLINLGQSWINSEKFTMIPTMIAIHGSMFAIAVFFILKRHYSWVILPKFFSKSHRKPQASPEKTTPTTKQATTTPADKTNISQKAKHKKFLWGRMPTVRKLLFVEITYAVLFVALGFLSLFFFFDFIDDLGDMSRKGYQFHHILIRSLLQVPAHLYELMPIVILIGTIFVLARMAQSSEFTILRTSGLSPKRALRLLAIVGCVGAFITFVLGDIIIPTTNQFSNRFMESFYSSQATPQRSMRAAWLKDKDDEYSYAVSVFQDSSHKLSLIQIYAFNDNNQLVSWINAPTATINTDGTWTLENATRSTLADITSDQARIIDEPAQNIIWNNSLNADVVSIATSKDTGLSILALSRFIQHLSLNGQDFDAFSFSLWQRLLYPFSCLVMVMLALPFAYLHFRSGGISTKVFGGIMIGISFVVINSMFGHIGQLQHWPPIISAGMPSLIYLLASLATFSWLVRNH